MWEEGETVFEHAVKTCGGMEVWLRTFLTSVLLGGDLSASRPGRLTPELGVPGTY